MPEEIVSVRFTDLFCAGLLESVSSMASAVALTKTVGVPVIAPVETFKERPAGRVPPVSDQV